MRLAQKFQSARQYGCIVILALLSGLLLHRGVQLYQAAQRPVDAVLVLGGSIRREMAAIDLAHDNAYDNAQFGNAPLPILISAGSPAPCIWAIAERGEKPAFAAAAGSVESQTPARATDFQATDPKAQIWLEPCATSTLGNYRFSLPVLQSWGAHHVQLITSGSHQLRATGLGRIILGSHGIWISPTPVAETGRPGNQESKLKTAVDWLRGLVWAFVSQLYAPQCDGLVRLDQVVLADWGDREFDCEHQGQVERPEIFNRP